MAGVGRNGRELGNLEVVVQDGFLHSGAGGVAAITCHGVAGLEQVGEWFGAFGLLLQAVEENFVVDGGVNSSSHFLSWGEDPDRLTMAVVQGSVLGIGGASFGASMASSGII